MPKTNSCCCGASPVSCCKMLWVFVLDDFFRCLHSFLYGSCYFLCMLCFDLCCEYLLVCHPSSSEYESSGWLQLRDSMQFAKNLAKMDFNPKQLVCKYPKPYFRVIPLFLELWKFTKAKQSEKWSEIAEKQKIREATQSKKQNSRSAKKQRN